MKSQFRLLISVFLLILPWFLRRFLLIKLFGYQLHPTARIGFSIVVVDRLRMGERSRIGHFDFIFNLEFLELGKEAVIGRGNWITGYRPKKGSTHYSHRPDRISSVILEEGAAIVINHFFDCTDAIRIGKFSTLAGYGSQFLTHAIDLEENRQDCQPIEIGKYCFIGTDVVILRGARLPDYCVLGAMSLLNKIYTDEYVIYGGVPAKPIGAVTSDMKYFRRNGPIGVNAN